MKTVRAPASPDAQPNAAAAANANAASVPSAVGPGWLAMLPFVFSLAVGAFALLTRVHQNPHLLWAFVGVSGGLVLWQLLLWLRAARTGRRLLVEPVAPVRQHYIQGLVQIVLYAYWGYLWQQQDGVRPIYAQAPLIVAQWLFLYAFDGLFAWSRGRNWRLSSGPTPIVLSTNLFIWFKDDWFVWQFAMLVAGLLGKEFLKWQKEGRRTHIFNPSGFGLACAATVLIVTGNVDLTWAKPLATTVDVPHIYLVLFLLGLVVQHFFAVTLMTFAAAVVMVLCNLAYTGATGVYLFGSTNLPAAAFLGLMLLMTDPSTSPRTNIGRTLFGAGYGLGYVVMFEVLGRLGAPELFAKLYPVPMLNCCVQWLDRFARSGFVGRLNERWQTSLRPALANHIHMALWSALFVVLLATHYLDSARHPGNSIAFWKRAVAMHQHEAERKLVMVAGSQALGGSADAINELGIASLEEHVADASEMTRHKSAGLYFGEAAARGSLAANENIVMHQLYDGMRRSDEEFGSALQVLAQHEGQPDGVRACQLLGLAYETGGGLPPDARRALELYRQCGDDPFAAQGVARIVLSSATPIEMGPAVKVLEASATAGDGESCYYLTYLCQRGRGVAMDPAKAKSWLQRARELHWAGAGDGPVGDLLPPFATPRRKQMSRPPWSTAFPVGG